MMSTNYNTTTIDGIQMPGSTNQAVVSNFPSTLVQGNNNGSTLSATAEEEEEDDDDDDATVQTTISNYYY
jgi:hypothetical protein